MNADVCKGPLKEKYNVYSIKEEGKHCSAPGSQVLTDFFFFPPHLPVRKRKAFWSLLVMPSASALVGSCRLWRGCFGHLVQQLLLPKHPVTWPGLCQSGAGGLRGAGSCWSQQVMRRPRAKMAVFHVAEEPRAVIACN